MMLGNKADLSGQEAVSDEDAAEFPEELGLFFPETSALKGENVEAAFLMLIGQIHFVSYKKSSKCEKGRATNGLNDILMSKGTEVSVLSEGSIWKLVL